MHWLCKIFGHKHLKGFMLVSFRKNYCQRCFAKSPKEENAGDSVLLCKIIGHKNRIVVSHDDGTDKHEADFCWNCHKTIKQGGSK